MQRYYQAAKGVTQLNTILLQNLEARLLPEKDAAPRALNERFQVRGELLEACREDLFEREPRAILESFLLLQQHQELRGMTAPTLRALWRARLRVNARLRRDPTAKLLFLQMLQQPRGIVHEFRRMNQYDVLGRYLPEFGRIVGQMQHDLFHVYTVDQHILMVVRNLRRFTMTEFAHEFPLCSQLMNGFERRWLLYVAALFHDIAKGRGGDHSELGMRDARAFARRHGLAREDADLVAFLVEHHLTMSGTAQKQDVHDPEVVQAFAAQGRQRAPPDRALPAHRRRHPRHQPQGVERAGRRSCSKTCSARRAACSPARRRDSTRRWPRSRPKRPGCCASTRLSDGVKDKFWAQLDTTYFLRHDAQEIAWQTRNLHYRVDIAGAGGARRASRRSAKACR